MDFKLILKKINNTLSEEEYTQFSEWYEESEDHKRYFQKVETNLNADITDVEVEKSWKQVEKRIAKSNSKKSYVKFAVAATVVLLLSLSYIFMNPKISDTNEVLIVSNNIESGSHKAILTLSNGSSVTLAKGIVFDNGYARSDGEQLIYTTNPKRISQDQSYNYLTVPLGGEFYLELSDKTKVWLNSETKLKYPVTFNKGETRRLELVYGEAYFNVSSSTKNGGSEFVIISEGQEIEVLGTEFNVKAYKGEENVLTSLIEGKVKIESNGNYEILSPGQQSIVNTITKSIISIDHKDIKSQVAWKNGYFIFDKKPLHEIMKNLSRWYTISFQFDDHTKEGIKFSGVLNRNENIADLLNNFQKTNEVSFKIDDKNIIIY